MNYFNVKNKVFSTLLLLLLSIGSLWAQSHKIGDLITFPDGSQGVVFYVNPNDSRKGYAAALEDLSGTYAYLRSNVTIEALEGIFGFGYTPNAPFYKVYGEGAEWGQCDYIHSAYSDNRILRSMGSPAALAVDYEHGWYVPEIAQMHMLIGASLFIPSSTGFTPLADANYWPCTKAHNNINRWYPSDNTVPHYDRVNGLSMATYRTTDPTSTCRIRPVRDFGDEVQVVQMADPTSNTATVRPSVDTTYDALVIFKTDTFVIPQTVRVLPEPVLNLTSTLSDSSSVCPDAYFTVRADYRTFSDSLLKNQNHIYEWSGFYNSKITTTSNNYSVGTYARNVGDQVYYVHAYDQFGRCHAYDTLTVTVKPFSSLPITTNDTICYGDTAILTGINPAATIEQYYHWYKGNTLVQTDTMAPGEKSILKRPNTTWEDSYVLTVNDKNTCVWNPVNNVRCYDTVNQANTTATDTVLMDAAHDGGSMTVHATDRIVFYDEGGRNGDYSTETVNELTYTFVAEEGQILLHVDTFNVGADAYLEIYDGPLAYNDDMGDLWGDEGSDYDFVSTNGSITVVWYNDSNSPENLKFGWNASVTMLGTQCNVSEANVTIKRPLDATAITQTTNDTICYDYTAHLTAKSDIDYPQYYQWWNKDLTEVLFNDTVQVAGDSSAFNPEHQQRDTTYYVTVSNKDNCPYSPERYRAIGLSRPEFLMSETSSTIYLQPGDSIPIYDNGGKDSNFISTGTRYCNFIAEQGHHVVLHLDTVDCARFWVYETSESGTYYNIARFNNANPAKDTTFVSSNNALRIQATGTLTKMGFAGYVTTDEAPYELADASVTISSLEVDILTEDRTLPLCAADTVLTATFTDATSTYTSIWMMGTDTVAIHANIPNSRLVDTLHYTAPSTASCGDMQEYHVIYVGNGGCEFVGATKTITLINESDFNGVPANDTIDIVATFEAVAPGAPDITDECGRTISPSYDPATDSVSTIGVDGTGTIEHTYTYTDCAGHDSTYTRVYRLSTISAPLRIASGDCTLEYNGLEQTCEVYTVTFDGVTVDECMACRTRGGYTHRYILPTTGDTVTIKDAIVVRDVVTDTANTYTAIIGHASRYTDVKLDTGRITVTPLAIGITAADSTKECDGTALTCDRWSLTSGTLGDGDAITSVTVTGSQDGVGTTPNKASDAKIEKGTENVTHNYTITYNDGQLTVTDTTKPTFTSPKDTTLYKDALCNADTTASSVGSPTNLADNCADASALTVTHTDGNYSSTCAGSYTFERVWRVTDATGNYRETKQTVTVSDTVRPVYERPKDTTVYKNGLCAADTTPAVTGQPTGVTDNCSGASELTIMHYDRNITETCSGSYTFERVWRVVDECGNVSAVADSVQTVTVSDTTRPEFEVPADTVICREVATDMVVNPDKAVTGEPSNLSDNCTDAATLQTNTAYTDVDPSTVDHNVVNYIERHWTVEDACGNVTEKVQRIGVFPAIHDGNTPMQCHDTMLTLAYGRCDTAIDLRQPTWSTSVTGAGTIRLSNDAPARFPEGATVVTWTLTDTCGFTVTCQQTVTVSYPPCGRPEDTVLYDGFTYHTVRVGCECWLQENLRNRVYSDGTPVAEYSSYNHSDQNEEDYGLLYTWYSAVRVPEGDNSAVPADSVAPMGEHYVEGACPAGWAVPTDAQYEDLWLNGYGASGLKDKDARYWLPGYAGTDPNSYFNARGAGYYDPVTDRYYNLLGETYFWTGEPTTNYTEGHCAVITSECPELLSKEQPKGRGQSIRCVQKR